MKNFILGLAIATVVILLAIKLIQPSIEGHWIADHVIDGDSDTLNIDASAIQLSIVGDSYTFLSTLNHRENGSIHQKGDDLLVKNDRGQSYKMNIADLSRSQLIIIMNVDGIVRKLVMYRSD